MNNFQDDSNDAKSNQNDNQHNNQNNNQNNGVDNKLNMSDDLKYSSSGGVNQRTATAMHKNVNTMFRAEDEISLFDLVFIWYRARRLWAVLVVVFMLLFAAGFYFSGKKNTFKYFARVSMPSYISLQTGRHTLISKNQAMVGWTQTILPSKWKGIQIANSFHSGSGNGLLTAKSAVAVDIDKGSLVPTLTVADDKGNKIKLDTPADMWLSFTASQALGMKSKQIIKQQLQDKFDNAFAKSIALWNSAQQEVLSGLTYEAPRSVLVSHKFNQNQSSSAEPIFMQQNQHQYKNQLFLIKHTDSKFSVGDVKSIYTNPPIYKRSILVLFLLSGFLSLFAATVIIYMLAGLKAMRNAFSEMQELSK